MLDFRSMTFTEYWTTYLPDLVDPLDDSHRRVVLENLFDGFLDGLYAGRETAQRLIEVHTGVITHAQYVSWSMGSERDDGTEHVFAHLVDGECLGGSREAMLDLLGHIDHTASFAHRIAWARRRGLLSEWEARRVIATSLRTSPLTAIVERADGVPALPFSRLFHTEPFYAVAG